MVNLDIENYHFEQFLRALDLDSVVSVEKSESPDYLMKIQGKQVGVEFTRFFLTLEKGKKPKQELHSLIELSVETARRCFRESGGPALYVNLHLAANTPQNKQQARDLGIRLGNALLQIDISEKQYISGDLWDLVPEIHSFRILHSIDGEDELWHAGHAEWVASIPSKEIQNILDKKSSKVSRYRKKCEELWLVIVHDIFRNGAASELSDEAKYAEYHHEFDRLIWVSAHKPSIIDLVKQNSTKKFGK